MPPDATGRAPSGSQSMEGAAHKAALRRLEAYMKAMAMEVAVLKAALGEGEGVQVLEASDPVLIEEPSKITRKPWPPPPGEIDFNDGTWFRGFKEAARMAKTSEATLRRVKDKIGVKPRGVWWIKIDRLNDQNL